ncbi:MAG: hypothetical protein CFK49_02680 [Armatimonadetes bacterium JP3_11]|nr:MAG: hypothetical protein CFK49_02680 [Armatimonadetes bacterium JP3_11]
MLQSRFFEIQQLHCGKLKLQFTTDILVPKGIRTPIRVGISQDCQADDFGILVGVEDMVVIDKHPQGEIGVGLRLNLDVNDDDAFCAIAEVNFHDDISGLAAFTAHGRRKAVKVGIQKLYGACPIDLVMDGSEEEL